MNEPKEIVSIEFHDLSVGQLVFVHAVVMPQIMDVIAKHMKDLEDLEDC